MSVHGVKILTCECGKLLFVVSDTMSSELRAWLREELEHTGGEVHVLTGQTSITCGVCGCVYHAPSPEMLDVERSELLSYLKEIEDEFDKTDGGE